MPYTGPGDPSLPENVKSKPKDARSQWVAIFNQVYDQTKDEGKAMTEANGATKALDDAAAGDKAGKMISADNASAIMSAMKALMDLLGKAGIDTAGMKALQLEVATKCGDDMPAVMVEPAPFGGATSFAQAVQFMAAQKQAGAVEDLTAIFRQLQDNILGNDDLGAEEKAGAITALSNEYATRLQDPVDNDPYYNGNKSG